MPFKKGQGRIGGRKKGKPNKTTQAAHEAIELAFEGVGGVKALIEWGKSNQTDFYRLWSRRIPNAQEVTGKDGEDLSFVVQVAPKFSGAEWPQRYKK